MRERSRALPFKWVTDLEMINQLVMAYHTYQLNEHYVKSYFQSLGSYTKKSENIVCFAFRPCELTIVEIISVAMVSSWLQ